jgi:hypothetical protein
MPSSYIPAFLLLFTTVTGVDGHADIFAVVNRATSIKGFAGTQFLAARVCAPGELATLDGLALAGVERICVR